MASKTERMREYRSRDPERWAEYYSSNYRSRRMRVYCQQSVRTAKARAAVSGVPFSIVAEDVMLLMEPGVCALSGLKFRDAPVPGTPSPYSPSLDRVVPSLGYVPGNIRLILNGLNSLKGAGTDEDLLAICRRVVEKHSV